MMELARTKIIIRLEKTAWVDGEYHYEDVEREAALLPVAEDLVRVVSEYLSQSHTTPGPGGQTFPLRFRVTVKRGSHKAKKVVPE